MATKTIRKEERKADPRESFSGRNLTNSQYFEGSAIVGILKREIERSGAFLEKLGDFVHAYARMQNFDVARAETIIRDLFKAITGKTMNRMREELIEREEKLTQEEKSGAYNYATAVGDMIEKGDKISFNRAYAHQGELLGRKLNITDAGAKRLMKEAFKEAHGSEFYDWGKDIEEKFYRPQIEAEMQQRDEKSVKRESSRSRGSRLQYQR